MRDYNMSYKYTTRDQKSCCNLITGSNHRKGTWTWREVQDFLDSGNTILPYDRRATTPVEQVRINLKRARNKSLSEVTVTVDRKVIWANPTEEQNIAGKIREMELEGKVDCKWIQGYTIHTLTLNELKEVLEEGTKKCAQIYDDYIAAIEAL